MISSLQEHITELESRVAFQDDTIEQLNAALQSQQLQLNKMERQLYLLAEHLKSLQPSSVVDQGQETPPPHY